MATFLVVMMGLNVGEAMVSDALAGWWVNAGVGLGLIATMRGPGAWSVRELGGKPHGVWSLGWPWIACYTAWNLAFVVQHYPVRFADHLAVLAAPALAAGLRRDPGVWAFARMYTLATFVTAVVAWHDALGYAWTPDAAVPAGLYPVLVALGALLLAVTIKERVWAR
jgi:hypothetical protein